MKNQNLFLQLFATDLIKKDYFRVYADKILDKLPAGVVTKNEKIKSKLSSISPALLGNTIENFYSLLLSPNDILEDIGKCILLFKEKHLNVAKIGYEPLDTLWIVFDNLDYELVTETLPLNTLHKYCKGINGIGIALEKKSFSVGEIEVFEEYGYKWVSNDNYYGRKIQRLESLKIAIERYLEDEDLDILISSEFTREFVFFSLVNHFMYGIVGRNFNLSIYLAEEIAYISQMLKTMPRLKCESNFHIKPSLRFKIELKNRARPTQLCFFGTPDFIVDNWIIDIKSTNSISKKDFYQILLYYIVSKYCILERHSNIVGGKLFYPKHKKVIELELVNIISDSEGEKLFEHILDGIPFKE